MIITGTGLETRGTKGCVDHCLDVEHDGKKSNDDYGGKLEIESFNMVCWLDNGRS